VDKLAHKTHTVGTYACLMCSHISKSRKNVTAIERGEEMIILCKCSTGSSDSTQSMFTIQNETVYVIVAVDVFC